MAKTRRGHGSDPKLTVKNRAFLDALFQNPERSVKDIAKAAGCSDRAAHYMLTKPHIRAEIDRRIRERLGTRAYVAAAERISKLIDGAASEYVQADLAKHVLAVNGVRPSSEGAQGAASGGIRLVINLPGVPSQTFGAIEQPAALPEPERTNVLSGLAPLPVVRPTEDQAV